jgi:Cu/Zn superoxide dismutase
VADTTTPGLGRLFIIANFKVQHTGTRRVKMYIDETLYFIFYNIFKIKKSSVMVHVNTPDDGNVVPKHVVKK